MLPFKLVYSDDYYLPIGAHVFPAEKYRLIHKSLLDTGVAEPADFVAPKPAGDDDVLRVHTREYVQKLKNGTLSPMEEMQMEVPYSPELVKGVLAGSRRFDPRRRFGTARWDGLQYWRRLPSCLSRSWRRILRGA